MLDFLTKQLWVLPVWAWIAIGAGVLLLLIIIIAAAASKKKKRKGPRRPKAKKKASKKGKRAPARRPNGANAELIRSKADADKIGRAHV